MRAYEAYYNRSQEGGSNEEAQNDRSEEEAGEIFEPDETTDAPHYDDSDNTAYRSPEREVQRPGDRDQHFPHRSPDSTNRSTRPRVDYRSDNVVSPPYHGNVGPSYPSPRGGRVNRGGSQGGRGNNSAGGSGAARGNGKRPLLPSPRQDNRRGPPPGGNRRGRDTR